MVKQSNRAFAATVKNLKQAFALESCSLAFGWVIVSKKADDNDDNCDDNYNDDGDDDDVDDDDDLIRSVASGSADCLTALCFRPGRRHHYCHLSSRS